MKEPCSFGQCLHCTDLTDELESDWWSKNAHHMSHFCIPGDWINIQCFLGMKEDFVRAMYIKHSTLWIKEILSA